VGVGGWGKYPGAPPHHIRKKRGKNKPTARYLEARSGERGKTTKKKTYTIFNKGTAYLLYKCKLLSKIKHLL
jgi:hypothetical protein